MTKKIKRVFIFKTLFCASLAFWVSTLKFAEVDSKEVFWSNLQEPNLEENALKKEAEIKLVKRVTLDSYMENEASSTTRTKEEGPIALDHHEVQALKDWDHWISRELTDYSELLKRRESGVNSQQGKSYQDPFDKKEKVFSRDSDVRSEVYRVSANGETEERLIVKYFEEGRVSRIFTKSSTEEIEIRYYPGFRIEELIITETENEEFPIQYSFEFDLSGRVISRLKRSHNKDWRECSNCKVPSPI